MSTFAATTRRRLLKAAGAFASAAAMPAPWIGRADALDTRGLGSTAIASKADVFSHDPFIWLEEMDSRQSRAWVTARNAETQKALCDDQFQRDRAAILDILNATDRIPSITKRGGYVYNFWRDEQNPKGRWRRTTLASYRTPAPDWETLLDIDALAKAEGEDWMWQGCTTLPPAHRLGLVQLSRGGADAVVIREFDLVKKRFVDGGFSLPEAKGQVEWLDGDTLLVTTALGGKAFETASGYARTVRRWRRGTPFAKAPVVFEGDRADVEVITWFKHGFTRRIDFFNRAFFVKDGGSLRKVDIPSDANTDVAGDWLVLSLRSDWEAAGHRYKAGSLLVTNFDSLLAGKRDFTVLFEPTPTCFLTDYGTGGDVVAFQVLDNVQSRILLARFQGGTWQVEPAIGLPSLDKLSFQRLPGRQQRRASRRQHADALSGAVRRHRVRGADSRHEALHQAAGRPELGRRIR